MTPTDAREGSLVGEVETDRWADGWVLYLPLTDPGSEFDDELELLAEALRRAVDLRGRVSSWV